MKILTNDGDFILNDDQLLFFANNKARARVVKSDRFYLVLLTHDAISVSIAFEEFARALGFSDAINVKLNELLKK